MVEANPGGWGAFATGDGQDGLINNVNGGFKDLPVEVYENKYPVTIREYGFRPDTGGPGRFRGGCGIRRAYHLEERASVYLWFERSVTPAWGLFDGGDAVGPEVEISPADGGERRLLKVNALPLPAGSVVRLHTGGGGGFGHPLERDPQLVRQDVLDGYVTHEAAEREYGVLFGAEGEVDQEATVRRRQQIQTSTR
jgi:N-methylhydantoinase B